MYLLCAETARWYLSRLRLKDILCNVSSIPLADSIQSGRCMSVDMNVLNSSIFVSFRQWLEMLRNIMQLILLYIVSLRSSSDKLSFTRPVLNVERRQDTISVVSSHSKLLYSIWTWVGGLDFACWHLPMNLKLCIKCVLFR